MLTNRHVITSTLLIPKVLLCCLQLDRLGVSETDSDSDTDEPDISHLPAVHNALNDLQYAELLLRHPPHALCRDNCRDVYIAVRHFVHSCCTV